MDFLTNRELNILSGEIEAKHHALEAEKYMFERKLTNGLGEKIRKELNHPTPKKVKHGIFYQLGRWLRKRKEHRLYMRFDRHERAVSMEEISKELKKKNGDL